MTKEKTNKQKQEHNQIKAERRERKRTEKRSITGEEVIYIFEKVLEGWKTIRIYNTMIQLNPTLEIIKKKVETISTGNCKVYPSELTKERFEYYLQLREKVYQFHSEKEKEKEKDCVITTESTVTK